MQAEVKKLVASPLFERFILVCISLNAVSLGVETIHGLPAPVLTTLFTLDSVFLLIFSTEILLKFYAYRSRFFDQGWNIFDLLIVLFSILAAGPLSVLRSLRVLRVVRMLSMVPSLKKVVDGLLNALPGLGSVASIMTLIFYIGSVMATKLFGATFPDWFGNLYVSAYSLFQIMTLESWSMGIARPVMAEYPFAWMFFVPFILVATFTMLNLFIAVIVNSLQVETEKTAESRATQGHDERESILEEIRQIRLQMDGLSRQMATDKGAGFFPDDAEQTSPVPESKKSSYSKRESAFNQ